MAFDITPGATRRKAALFAVVGVIICGVAVYYAISGEVTGNTTAMVSHGKRVEFVAVNRTSAPKEFRKANDYYWAASLLGFGIAAVGIYFYRGIGDGDEMV